MMRISQDYSRLTVIHTVVGLQLAHGGPSRSIPAMADAQARLGANVHVLDMLFDARAQNGTPEVATFHGVEGAMHLSWLRNNHKLASVIRDIDRKSKTPSLFIHDHGLWMPQNKLIPQLSLHLNRRLVISPRGMLSPWSLNRRRIIKKIIWRIWQKRALQIAAGFHATSSSESADIRAAGLTQPVSVVPNSIRIPLSLPQKERDQSGRRKLLFLSRIHPVKGVKELLVAFKNANVSSEWVLHIVGPGDHEYTREVIELCKTLNLNDRVIFEGSVSDNDKWGRYCNADLFILPSFSENFGLVIAEALAAGLPVITTTGTPWQCIRDEGFGWWVTPNALDLSGAISQATGLAPEKLRIMGQKGSAYVRSRFNWDASARELLDFYQTL